MEALTTELGSLKSQFSAEYVLCSTVGPWDRPWGRVCVMRVGLVIDQLAPPPLQRTEDGSMPPPPH